MAFRHEARRGHTHTASEITASLGDLSDVTLTGEVNGDVIQYNGSAWVNVPVATAIGTIDHGLLSGLGDDDHPQYAALAQDETITGAWTFNQHITISAGVPILRWYDTGGTTDGKYWYLGATDANKMIFATRNDARTAQDAFLTVTRAANVVTLLELDAASYSLGADSQKIVATTDATDLTWTFSSTADWNISGLTGNIRLDNALPINWLDNLAASIELLVFTASGGAAAGDSAWDDVVFLCHFDGTNGQTTYTDSSQIGGTMNTFGTAAISTAQSVFGGASLLLDGNSDYVTCTDNAALTIATQDFTIEARVRCTTTPSTSTTGGFCVAQHYSNIANVRAWFLRLRSSNTLNFWCSENGIAGQHFEVSYTFNANQWYDVAVSRVGVTFYFFVDGTLIGTDTNGGTVDIFNSTAQVRVGAIQTTAGNESWFAGYIDEVRFTVGTARYTSTYTIAAEASPEVAGSTSSTFVVGDPNYITYIDGQQTFLNSAYVKVAGGEFWVLDSTGGDSLKMSHDGTDFNSVFVNTTDWNISGAANYKFDEQIYITPAVLDDPQWMLRLVHTSTSGFYYNSAAVDLYLRDDSGTTQARFGNTNTLVNPLTSSANSVRQAAGFIVDSDTHASIYLKATTGSADEDNWGIDALSTSSFRLTSSTDANGAGNTFLEATRSGVTISDLTLTSNGTLALVGVTAVRVPSPFQVRSGNTLSVFDSTNTDSAAFTHDGTDFNTVLTTTADWNLSGATNYIFSGNLSGTTIGGITEASLVDKTATETISGAWHFSGDATFDAINMNTDDLDNYTTSSQSGFYRWTSTATNAPFTFASGVFIHDGGQMVQLAFGSGSLPGRIALRRNNSGTWSDWYEAAMLNTAGSLYIKSGAGFRVYDSTDTDYLDITHDGTDARILVATTAILSFEGASSHFYFDNSIWADGGVYIAEQAAAGADTAGRGQIWIEDEAPCVVMFTDDAGTDVQLSPAVIHLPKDVTQDIGGAAATVTYVSWDATAIKKDVGFTHEDVTNPSRIQIDRTGRYEIKFMVSWTQSGAARTTLMSHLRVDGSTSVTRGRQRNYSRGAVYGDGSVGMITELDVTAGSYIECGITVDATDATYTCNTINGECEVIVRRLS